MSDQCGFRPREGDGEPNAECSGISADREKEESDRGVAGLIKLNECLEMPTARCGAHARLRYTAKRQSTFFKMT